MVYPFNGSYKINQYFNDPCCRASYAQFGLKGHNGIDFGVPNGTPILSSVTGKVYVGYEPGGYGNYIFVTGEGYETIYGHLQRAIVVTGQVVAAGQQIAYSDNTGFSSGAHLHFGTRPVNYNPNNGFLGYIDPLPLLTKGADVSDGLADLRLAKINDIRQAVYLPARTDTNSVDDILDRVRIVNGDADNLFRDLLGRNPTPDDYGALRLGPKNFVYYLESEAKKLHTSDAESKINQIKNIIGG